MEHKKQQEKLVELRQEVHRAKTALVDERAENTRLLDEAARERMELHKQQYEEKERATTTLQRLKPKFLVSLQGAGGGNDKADRATEE